MEPDSGEDEGQCPRNGPVQGLLWKRLLARGFPWIVLMLLAVSTLTVVSSSLVQPYHEAPPADRVATVMIVGSAPEVYPQPTVEGNIGVVLNISAYVYDADDQPLHVEWDFGDGSPNGTNDTGPAGSLPEVIQQHAWSPTPIPGLEDYYFNYTLNITATDPDGNNGTASVPVSIYVPFNGIPMIHIVVPLTIVDPADTVTIVADAQDPEGEPLTWTFVYNDSIADFRTEVYHTGWTAPNEVVYNNLTYVFGAAGNYTVTAYVSDAEIGYQVFPHNISQKSQTIRVATNRLPYIGAVTFTPSNTQINASIGYLIVTFSVQCLDQDGDPLNVTWDFGDGTYAWNESTGGTDVFVYNQSRNYTDAGSYLITVNLTDGRPGHNVTDFVLLNISATNLPPFLRVDFKYADRDYALPNETLRFIINISDAEGDAVELMIDFGDNSPRLYYNLTDYVAGNITLTIEHSYSLVGHYNMTIVYTDNKKGIGQHNLTTNLTLDVSVPPPIIRNVWSWWDYTSLSLFGLMPVLIVLRFFMVARRRKRAEEEGLSLEEWYLLQEQKRQGLNGKTA